MKLLSKMMDRFVKVGSLTIHDAQGGTHTFGPGGEPAATIRLHDPALYRSLFLNPELKAGEAYMDGTLTVDGGIRKLLEVFAHNRDGLRKQGHQKLLKSSLKRVRRFHQHNIRARAAANVEHHYDLSNDFYRMWLSDDLNYSCAYWPEGTRDLAEAQRRKMAHIAAKLRVEPGMRVLDIGCGWGAMSHFLAEACGAQVVGVTLSSEQLAVAKARAAERGLACEFRLQDYRDVAETFDRVVSVGMFEHVGVRHYLEYFSKISELLSDDGCALVHSIGRKGGPGTTGAWIRKYIFPGGYSPALSETFAEIEKAGLWVTDCEIWRLHYAETLRAWDDNFQAVRERVVEMFDERFARMWEFYLVVSEFSFRFGKHMNFQIQLSKEVGALPLSRDYMVERERELLGAAPGALAREPVAA